MRQNDVRRKNALTSVMLRESTNVNYKEIARANSFDLIKNNNVPKALNIRIAIFLTVRRRKEK